MRIIEVEDYEKMSKAGAEMLAQVIKDNPCATLGLATGTTPIGAYKLLIEKNKSGKISFKNIRTVNLDEYVGLKGDNVHSYRYFMNNELFDRVDIDKNNTYIPSGASEALEMECKKYDEIIEKYPRDIQLLGIGSDGHIGFNEPGSSFEERTHVVELAVSTIFDNARLFKRIEDVPVRAVTMGIADIMKAKSILVMANGKNKAEALRNMINGEVSESCPASILRLHKNVTVIADKDATYLL